MKGGNGVGSEVGGGGGGREQVLTYILYYIVRLAASKFFLVKILSLFLRLDIGKKGRNEREIVTDPTMYMPACRGVLFRISYLYIRNINTFFTQNDFLNVNRRLVLGPLILLPFLQV